MAQNPAQIAAQIAAQNAAFLDRQLRYTQRFLLYRQQDVPVTDPVNPPYIYAQIPRPGHFLGVAWLPPPLRTALFPARYRVGIPHNQAQANQANERLKGQLEPYEMQFERILGWGGNGVAALFSRRQVGRRKRELFVAKCNIVNSQTAKEQLQTERAIQAVGTTLNPLLVVGWSCTNGQCCAEIPRRFTCRPA